MNNGGLVRSLFAWRNFDNAAEIGWKWYDIAPSDNGPKFFAFWVDQGNPRKQPWEEGNAGERDVWRIFKVDNDLGGNHWTFHAGGDQVAQHTFGQLHNNVFIWGNSEVKNRCDSADAHFRDLTDKNCDGCPYGDWLEIEKFEIGTPNPCHHVELVSATKFNVLHGAGAGETC